MTTFRKSVVTFKLRAFGLTLLSLSACTQLQTEQVDAPARPADGTRSTAVASNPTNAETGVTQTVTVKVADKRGQGISNVTPVLTAVDASNASTGITANGCSLTDVKGLATCRITSVKAGAYTLKVTSPAVYMGGTIVFNQVKRGLRFSAQPTCTGGCTVAGAFSAKVTVVDAAGVDITSDNTSSVALTVTGGGVTLGGTLTATAVNGVASFNALPLPAAPLLPTKAGTYTLTATSGSASGVSSNVTVAAAAAAKLKFMQQPSASTASNVDFAQQPIVGLFDAYDNAVTGTNCTITVSLSAGTGSLLGTVSRPSASGVSDFATNHLRVDTSAGGAAYALTATSAGLTVCPTLAAAVSDPFEITLAGVPAQLTIVATPSTAALSQVWPTQPVIQVLDAFGNLVSNDNTTVVTITKTAGTGALAGSQSVLVSNGTATFANLSIASTDATHAGTYQYNFQAFRSGLTIAPITATQSITADGQVEPFKLEFLVQPSGASRNQVMPRVQVRKVDANGHLNFTENNEKVTIALVSGTDLTPSPAEVTMAGGIATFSNLKIASAGLKQFTATSDNTDVDGATSGNFAISDFGTPVKLAFTNALPIAGRTGNLAWSPAPQVSLQDSAGNTVTNDSSTVVSIALYQWNYASDPTLIGNVSKPFTAGVADFDDVRTMEMGVKSITLRATVAGDTYTAAMSNTFNGNTAQAVKLRVVSQPIAGVDNTTNQPAYCWVSNSSSGVNPITVEILDADDQRITTDNNTVINVTCGNAACTGIQNGGPYTMVNGLATLSGLQINQNASSATLALTPTGAPGVPAVNTNAFSTGACP